MPFQCSKHDIFYLGDDDSDSRPELLPDGVLHHGRLGEAPNQEEVPDPADAAAAVGLEPSPAAAAVQDPANVLK